MALNHKKSSAAGGTGRAAGAGQAGGRSTNLSSMFTSKAPTPGRTTVSKNVSFAVAEPLHTEPSLPSEELSPVKEVSSRFRKKPEPKRPPSPQPGALLLELFRQTSSQIMNEYIS